jgi:hypothetical protein
MNVVKEAREKIICTWMGIKQALSFNAFIIKCSRVLVRSYWNVSARLVGEKFVIRGKFVGD